MIPIGLIMNEALSNSFKYAFKDKKGEISISISKNTLTISDNGTGITKEKNDIENSSFGMQLIELLAEQIDAKINIKQLNGTSIELKF